jgi:hypothetical protein
MDGHVVLHASQFRRSRNGDMVHYGQNQALVLSIERHGLRWPDSKPWVRTAVTNVLQITRRRISDLSEAVRGESA